MRQTTAALFGAIVLAGPALAQGRLAPAPQPAAQMPNPAFEAAEQAFNALDEASRKAIQSDLIWVGGFTATVSGSFGRRTYDAILTFERATRSTADGLLDPAERKALAEAAGRARTAARYSRQIDGKTGAAFGLPLAQFPKRETLPNGSRWTSADGAVTLETANAAGDAAALPQAFERIMAIPGRKVTYKLLRPEFFVIAGEAGPRSFYTRFAPGTGRLVGYTISYPTPAAKAMERTVIALANSFEPVAGAAPVETAAAVPATPTAPSAPAAPEGSRLPAGVILTGLVIAPGRIVAPSLANACANLTANGRPARTAAETAPAGLVMLEADTGTARPYAGARSAGADGTSVVAIGYVAAGTKAELSFVSGTLLASGNRPARLQAPLHREAGGSLVVDRSGNLVGLVSPPPAAPRLVAGLVPTSSHALIAYGTPASAGAPTQTGGAQTSGALVARFAASLVALRCGQPVPLSR